MHFVFFIILCGKNVVNAYSQQNASNVIGIIVAMLIWVSSSKRRSDGGVNSFYKFIVCCN